MFVINNANTPASDTKFRSVYYKSLV